MPRLLIVHHTPSPHCQEMFEAVVAGATDPEIEGVEVVRRPALTVSPVEMLEADGYLLGSPVNLGYVSGALKQLNASAAYRGRIMALWVYVFIGTTPIGSVITGWIITAAGARAAFLVGAGSCAAAAALAACVRARPHAGAGVED